MYVPTSGSNVKPVHPFLRIAREVRHATLILKKIFRGRVDVHNHYVSKDIPRSG